MSVVTASNPDGVKESKALGKIFLTAKQHLLTMRGSPKTYRGSGYLVQLLPYFSLTLLEVLLSSSLALTTVLLFLGP